MAVSGWSRASILLLAAALLSSVGNALPAKRQQSSSHDFIIVGGGTAGLTLAARLSEDGTQSVLVLEAGAPPETVASYKTPGSDLEILGSAIDWSYGTLPQPGLNGRQITYNSGKCLGGSSAINGMAYVRGSSSIYNLWSSMGNSGWSWDDVFPYFKKSTTFNAPATDNITAQGFDASLYTNGPLQLAYPPYVYSNPGSEAFVESIASIGIPSVEELNAGTTVGAKHEMFTMDPSFKRSSSYDSYYMQARNRPNLQVLTMSPVRQIILNQTSGDPIATGVVYTDYASGQTLNATANKEVILSAGAFKTPQLLMLSGVGPAETLKDAGVQQYVVNENIGKNLQDHIYFSVIAEADPSISYSSLYHDYSKLQEATSEYEQAMGPLTAPIGIAYAFEKLSTETLDGLGASNLTTQNRTDQAHIEYFYESIYYPNLPSTMAASMEYNTSYVSFTAAVVSPTSRGTVSILSNSLSMPPQIDPQYYSTQDDQALALYSFKNLRTVLAKFAKSGFTVGANNGEVVPGPLVQSDEDILNHIRETAIPVSHASGTCAMLPLEKGGVVDENLKVYGVQGLRVVDASVFPVIPDTHPVAAVYMIAEKAADMIKAQSCA